MANTANKDNTWQISRSDENKDIDQATYSNKSFSVRVDLTHPGEGLQDVSFQGSPTHVSSLRISAEPPTPKGGETVIESYVRGDDLIVTYAQTPARTIRPQIYWSALNFKDAHGIQATISAQTSLLDSDPTIRSHSRLGQGDLFQPKQIEDNGDWQQRSADDACSADSPSLFLFRPNDADWSYAEILFPTDFQGAQVTAKDDALQIEFSMFPEFLEKGVIRRGRIQSLFMPRTNDQQVAIAAYRELANSPAPLTT